MILPDIMNIGLDIVFCGTAAGDKSAQRGAFYAGPGNRFYSTLHFCGWTDRILQPHEFPLLPNYKLGLTDLAKHVHGGDHKLRPQDFDIEALISKITQFQPRFICFNGKKAASVFLKSRSTTSVNYGLQQSLIGSTRIFVAPSTSGAARGAWDISHWQSLKDLLDNRPE